MSLTFTAGQQLTADSLNALVPQRVIKSTNQTVTSSTTLVNDSELFLDLVAGHTYRISLNVIGGGATAGDIKIGWTTSGTMSMVGTRLCTGPGVSTATTADTTARVSAFGTLTTAFAYGTDSTLQSGINEEFLLTVTANGRLTMQWAQNASSGTASTVGAGSWLMATPVF